MIRTLTAVAALAALATPALAEVRLNVAGKDAATVESLVADAARTACRDELRGSLGGLQSMQACITIAQQDAMAQFHKLRSATYASAGATTPLAVTRVSVSK